MINSKRFIIGVAAGFIVLVILGSSTLYAAVMLVMLLGNVVLWNICKAYR